MTATEKVSLTLGAVVSLVTLIGSVWYAAISFNSLSVSIDRYSTEMVALKTKVDEKEGVHAGYEKRLDSLEYNQRLLIAKTPTIVYVNTKFIILSTASGEIVKIPKLPNDE